MKLTQALEFRRSRHLSLATGFLLTARKTCRYPRPEPRCKYSRLREHADVIFLSACVEPRVTTVRTRDGQLEASKETFAEVSTPLEGFSVIEADTLDEVEALVAKTSCARGKGAVQVH